MSDKAKVGFYWCASCGGCEESVVDLAEEVLTVLDHVEIVFWPVAMDFKRSDVENMEDGEIFVTMINGAVRTSEQEEMAHLLRQKSKLIIAYGSCAHTGGIPGLANQFSSEEILQYIYHDAPTVTNHDSIRPQTNYKENGYEVELPQFRNRVKALDQVIDVDNYLPGCPPTPAILKKALFTLLEGDLPEKGAVLAPDLALCNECPRKESKPEEITFEEFKRPHEVKMDPELCFLAQNVLCMGLATRGGCEALCVNGNMPCGGCFGPLSEVEDQGAKVIASIGSTIKGLEESEIYEVLDTIPDPVGTFYRYALPASLIKEKVSDTHSREKEKSGNE